MSYVENIVYSYIKNLLVGGLIILTNKRFIFYSSSVLIISAMLTAASLVQLRTPVVLEPYKVLFNLELAICVSLIITGLVTLKTNVLKAEHIMYMVLILCLFFFFYFKTHASELLGSAVIYIGFYSWIFILNIVVFAGIRDFLVSLPGLIVSLGDSPDRMVFEPIIVLAVLGASIWFAYNLFTGDFHIIEFISLLTSVAILYTIFIFRKAYDDALIASMLSIFFLTLLYHLFVRGSEGATGFLFLDIFIIMLVTIMSAQGIANMIAGRKHVIYYWDSLILIMLGFMLCYHLLAIRLVLLRGLGQLFSIYHDIAYGFGSLMIFGILITYTISPNFRRISKRQVSAAQIANQATIYAKESINKVKEILKGEWKLEIKKPKDEEEL